MEVPPLLVQVLGGNVVTTAAVLACLNTANATVLRRLHPALAAAVAAVPWADTTTHVRDTIRWRAALPAATALKPAENAILPLYYCNPWAALEGVTVLDLAGCSSVSDTVVAGLPPSLRVLNMSECTQMNKPTGFTHLPALELLNCRGTKALVAGLACLPPSLRELHMRYCKVPDTVDFGHLCNLRVVTCGQSCLVNITSAASLQPSLEVLHICSECSSDGSKNPWPHGWSVAHLTRLRELHASCTTIGDAAVGTLPPSIRVLDLEDCDNLSLTAFSFAHLTCLHTLSLGKLPISSDTLATLPPSLVSLDLHQSRFRSKDTLAPATVYPILPSLRVLNVSHTGLGDAAIASMPVGLEELTMVGCSNVTQRAHLDHLAALRVLQSAGTTLSRATLEACRARGCFAPADGKLALEGDRAVNLLVPLPDGRLVSGATYAGCVALWQVDAGRGAIVAELELCDDLDMNALAVLPDGHRVVVGTSTGSGIVVWDTRDAPHEKQVVTSATIACGSGVWELAVAPNGHLS